MPGEGRIIDSMTKGGPIVLPEGAIMEGAIRTKRNDYIHEFFDSEPVSVKKAGAGAATGSTGDENLMKLNNSLWEYHILGTQTIVSPTMGVGGLDVNMDQTNNDGVELCLGINAANRGVFTVGTSPAFYAKMKFSIADVSGTDDCAFGFRKVEAYQAAIDNYDEMAAINVINRDIYIETILNGGATATVNTTKDWNDGETHMLEVLVAEDGVVTFRVDGTIPPITASFTFDSGEVVVPFFYFLNSSDIAGEVVLKEFECGLQ